jgi:hypothetical protein
MVLIQCTICLEEWHITWSREWDKATHQYIGIPSNEFVCLTCKVGGKQ